MQRQAVSQRPPRATVFRHTSALGKWELAKARPVRALQPFVREYTGWFEAIPQPLRRRELPTEEAPLIINFGGPFRLFAPGGTSGAFDRVSFVTGAFDTYQVVESAGETHGVQINFTLLGMRLLVGRPIEDMTNSALAPEDVFGPFARELAGRLYDAASWDSRFDYLDRALLARLAGADDLPSGVRYAWEEICRSGGRTSIRTVAKEVGWSHRHFTSRFRQELGITPKVLARVMRFGRFVRAARRGAITNLADAAVRCEYFDQSHLHRDAREFAGATPGELLKGTIPDGGGFVI